MDDLADPSVKWARAMELKKLGMSYAEVARAVGSTKGTVAAALYRLRHGPNTKRGKPPTKVRMAMATLDYYHEEAKKRGVDHNHLIREVLRVIADDDMLKSVLDD